jgi:hypothetical protein
MLEKVILARFRRSVNLPYPRKCLSTLGLHGLSRFRRLTECSPFGKYTVGLRRPLWLNGERPSPGCPTLRRPAVLAVQGGRTEARGATPRHCWTASRPESRSVNAAYVAAPGLVVPPCQCGDRSRKGAFSGRRAISGARPTGADSVPAAGRALGGSLTVGRPLSGSPEPIFRLRPATRPLARDALLMRATAGDCLRSLPRHMSICRRSVAFA